MISPFTIYLISICDNVGVFAVVIAIVCGLTALGFFISFIIHWIEAAQYCNKNDSTAAIMCRRMAVVFLIGLGFFGMIASLIPSSRAAAAMVVIPAVANNEKVQGITSNSLTILQNLTEKWAKDVLEEGVKAVEKQ